jgi:hypothetical protein
MSRASGSRGLPSRFAATRPDGEAGPEQTTVDEHGDLEPWKHEVGSDDDAARGAASPVSQVTGPKSGGLFRPVRRAVGYRRFRDTSLLRPPPTLDFRRWSCTSSFTLHPSLLPFRPDAQRRAPAPSDHPRRAQECDPAEIRIPVSSTRSGQSPRRLWPWRRRRTSGAGGRGRSTRG